MNDGTLGRPQIGTINPIIVSTSAIHKNVSTSARPRRRSGGPVALEATRRVAGRRRRGRGLAAVSLGGIRFLRELQERQGRGWTKGRGRSKDRMIDRWIFVNST